MKYRTAKNTDINNIMLIENSSFSSGIIELQESFLERISTFPEGFLLLETSGYDKPIGYICSEIWKSKKTINNDDFKLCHSINDKHNPEGQELYISSLAIMPKFRGFGLGLKLFNELFNRVLNLYPNIKSSILIVSEKWRQARNIYKSSGFKEITTIKDFFQPIGFDCETGIVMRKHLR